MDSPPVEGPIIQGPTTSDSPAIEVRSVAKSFGDVAALDRVDLAVQPGTVLGLLGPNGAGKTTMVRILTTILAPDSGEARVLGHDVVTDAPAVRARIGLAGQYAAVDENLTGRENLRMVGELTHQRRPLIGARADELLERFALTGAAGRPVRTYSGGMRRRLDLAAALVHRPPVLFLDEPTTGLDPQGRQDLWSVIGELVNDGTTLLLTTQYLEEAEQLADWITVIDGGKVIAEGTAAELKQRLGTTIVEVQLADPSAAGRAAERLQALGAVDGQVSAGTVTVTVDDGARDVVKAVRLLDADGLTPERAFVREATLDDVFLTLTGHRAEPTPADEKSPPPEAPSEQGDAA